MGMVAPAGPMYGRTLGGTLVTANQDPGTAQATRHLRQADRHDQSSWQESGAPPGRRPADHNRRCGRHVRLLPLRRPGAPSRTPRPPIPNVSAGCIAPCSSRAFISHRPPSSRFHVTGSLRRTSTRSCLPRQLRPWPDPDCAGLSTSSASTGLHHSDRGEPSSANPFNIRQLGQPNSGRPGTQVEYRTGDGDRKQAHAWWNASSSVLSKSAEADHLSLVLRSTLGPLQFSSDMTPPDPPVKVGSP